MRKIILIIVLLISLGLTGCVNMHNENSSNIYNENVEVNFVEMDYYEIEFDKIEFPVNLSEMNFSKSEISIYTKQDAFEKGNLIIEELHSKGKNKNKGLLSVVHSKQNNMWCFYYSTDQRNKSQEEWIAYDALYVAVDGNSGKIIMAWAEEG